jgi:predicted RecA/RadA family phage recombinase
MAKNFVYDQGNWLPLVPDVGPNDPVLSGDPVLVGDLPGVAVIDADDELGTGVCTVKMDGVATLEVTGATAVGDIVYMAAAGTLSTTNTDTRFGYALEAQAATGTIMVKVGY